MLKDTWSSQNKDILLEPNYRVANKVHHNPQPESESNGFRGEEKDTLSWDSLQDHSHQGDQRVSLRDECYLAWADDYKAIYPLTPVMDMSG